MISVIIIDDHPLVLNGFQFVLKDNLDISLKSVFASADEALKFLENNTVDIVLIDINMPDMNGIEATITIRKQYPSTRVIAISNLSEGSIVRRMLDAGATGYLLKNVSAGDLIGGIHATMRGEQTVSSELKSILDSTTNAIPKITQREHQVLKLLAQGQTTPQIGESMFISPLTVESHRRNLLQKFGVSNSVSLIHKATEMKFI